MNIATKIGMMLDSLVAGSVELAKNIVFALIAYFIGKYLIKLLCRLVKKVMERREVDITVANFINNLVKIILQITLFICIIGILGVKTTSLMALIASTGFGIGLALSGTLQNFANGILLLLFKPYKVGDYIETQGVGGTVKAVHIFHTILITTDNKTIYVPNGSMNGSVMTNFSQEETRRIDLTIGIDYGEDFSNVKSIINRIISAENRILHTPEALVEITQFADSSVNVLIRFWVKSSDYWSVYYKMNDSIYATFNANNINFPYPQLTVHQG
ncbi:MAG: mechanosensitive ion channel [Prevotellaceae bacterium]|jgi:small conductance mechanosensitive channel|nr:mechanosensitive ion channel [Prevotellaceae bacterium]